MKIENEFRVGVPIEKAWDVLTDIPAIAPCLPGAKLTGQDGDTYEGTMKIKVGPVTAEYKGSAVILEQDEASRKVVLEAKGRDSRGSGNASADITANMTPDGDGTKVSIVTDLKVAGKVAQFGRGVMADVSKKLLGQFADCIEAKLENPADVADKVAAAGAASAAGGSAPGAASAAGSTGTAGSSGASSTTTQNRAYSAAPADNDDDALDLMDVAGDAMAKRALPVVGGVVVAALMWLLFRRRKS